MFMILQGNKINIFILNCLCSTPLLTIHIYRISLKRLFLYIRNTFRNIQLAKIITSIESKSLYRRHSLRQNNISQIRTSIK